MSKSPSAAFRRSAAALEQAAKILAEAIAIVDLTKAPERVYVPHMESFGTIQQVYGDGELIGVMLDSGIFMQTNRAFTQSLESAIYNEESAKSPLTNTSSLLTAEAPKTLQLSLF